MIIAKPENVNYLPKHCLPEYLNSLCYSFTQAIDIVPYVSDIRHDDSLIYSLLSVLQEKKHPQKFLQIVYSVSDIIMVYIYIQFLEMHVIPSQMKFPKYVFT